MRHDVFPNRATTKHIHNPEFTVTWLKATRYASEYRHTNFVRWTANTLFDFPKLHFFIFYRVHRTKLTMPLFGYGNATKPSAQGTQQPQDMNAQRLRRENRRRSSELRQSDEQSTPAPTNAGASTAKRSDTPTLRQEDPPASQNLTREDIQKWR